MGRKVLKDKLTLQSATTATEACCEMQRCEIWESHLITNKWQRYSSNIANLGALVAFFFFPPKVTSHYEYVSQSSFNVGLFY